MAIGRLESGADPAGNLCGIAALEQLTTQTLGRSVYHNALNRLACPRDRHFVRCLDKKERQYCWDKGAEWVIDKHAADLSPSDWRQLTRRMMQGKRRCSHWYLSRNMRRQPAVAGARRSGTRYLRSRTAE